MITELSHSGILVSDLGISVDYYTRVIGGVEVAERPGAVTVQVSGGMIEIRSTPVLGETGITG